MRINKSPGWAALLIVVFVTWSPAHTITFQASSPGAELELIAGEPGAIEISQDETSISWVSPAYTVESHMVKGWPSMSGGDEIGGGLALVRTEARSGVIEFGEQPMLLTFDARG